MAKYEHKRKLTDDNIVKAFLQAGKAKGVDAVTVSDIIQYAQVNRSTFYRHYQDKYDLIEQLEHRIIEEIDDANKDFNKFSMKDASIKDIKGAANQFVYQFLTVIEKYQPILQIMISDKGNIQFTIHLLHYFSTMVSKTTTSFISDMNDKSRRLMSSYYSSTAFGVVVFWIHNFDEYSKDDIYNFLISQ